MRGFDCACGEYIQAENDEKLLQQMRSHADQDHKDQFSDAQLQSMRNQSAYDVREEGGDQPLI